MSDIVLSAGVRQNLLSLQKTAQLMSTTQTRLATGKKVNSALDNAVNFFTAAGLTSRAGDLNALLDSMSNGIKTIEAANNGLTAITTTIQNMQSTLMQARQDSSWQSTSYTINAAVIGTTSLKQIAFTGGSVGGVPVNVNLNDQETITGAGGFTGGGNTSTVAGALTIQAADINGGTAISVNVALTDTAATVAAAINTAVGYTLASTSGTQLVLKDAGPNVITVGGAAGVATAVGLAATSTPTAGAVETVDQLVNAINANASLIGKVKASNDAGSLRISNLSTSTLTTTGITSTFVDGSTSTATIGGNTVRSNLVAQFNQLRDQLDKLSDDASFMGINLLQGDLLKVIFNELGTSTIDIQSRDPNGNPFVVNSSNLNIKTLQNSDLDSNTNIDGLLSGLSQSLEMVRSQASNFGSTLSVVQNRQDFTKSMITTLQTGADNLTLADTNEEGANMLALQTRQQLSITALSLASQAQQSVLKLFG
jgi:flagellin